MAARHRAPGYSGEPPPPQDVERQLDEQGYSVVAGALSTDALPVAAAAYDRVVADASPDDVSSDGSNLRVHDLLDRDCAFDPILLFPRLLAAAGAVIAGPFKLSVFLARSVLPGARPQALHVDFAPRDGRWPMLGFILMVDDFTAGNGATLFVPGSHRAPRRTHDDAVPACGRAGSMILYNGSVVHGYGGNVTAAPRRSVQGALIARSESGRLDGMHLQPETLARLGSYLCSQLSLDS